MINTLNIRDRYRGALLGLACGDAVGATLEFKPPGTFNPTTNMIGGGPFNLKPGQWTDDTSMALCLGESLVECGGFNPVDQMQRYLRWWQDGYLNVKGHCFDIGLTVSAALGKYQKSGHPFAGSTDSYSAGNGSLMRLAPIPLAFRADVEQAIHYAGESSRTTHGAQACIDACRYYTALIICALAGRSKVEILSPDFYQGSLVLEIAEIATGSYKRKNPPAIAGTGYVVRSLEAALWAFYHSSSFAEGALMAANLGDDADTTAAVFGQLAGAFYGASGIPAKWLAKLAMRGFIEKLANDLLALSEK
jgi:ADP-ribosyl-[dinitrogen reductase] hydrolase